MRPNIWLQPDEAAEQIFTEKLWTRMWRAETSCYNCNTLPLNGNKIRSLNNMKVGGLYRTPPPTHTHTRTLLLSPANHLEKNQFPSPAERPRVSPVCLIDDAQTPSHTSQLFMAPPSWPPFSAFLWQIITGNVTAFPPGE